MKKVIIGVGIILIVAGIVFLTRDKPIIMEKWQVFEYCKGVKNQGNGCVCDSLPPANTDKPSEYLMVCRIEKASNIQLPAF